MANHHNHIDLSAATVTLLGICFSRVLDQIDMNAVRNDHDAGALLADALHRAGFTVTRPRPVLLVCPIIDAHARVRRMWESDPLEDTVEMPAPLHLLEAGE